MTRSGKCLTLSAGASYESRIFHNAYSVITLDPLHARSEVLFVQYKPSEGAFSYESHRSYSHDLDAPTTCPALELSVAIAQYYQDAADISYYLASLLLGEVTDVPIRADGTVAFGALALLSRHNDGELIDATHGALAVGRVVRLLYGRKPLNEILIHHGEQLRQYIEALRVLDSTNSGLWEQMLMRNNDAAGLAGAENATPFQHTLGLMDDLLAQGDWEGLQEAAERCSNLDNPAVAAKGKRALALCFARYTEHDDRLRAMGLYRELTVSDYGEAGDWAAIATMLTDAGNHEEAKSAVKEGIRTFPGKISGFLEVGMKSLRSLEI